MDNQLESIITLAGEFTNTLSVDKNGYFVKRMVDTKGLANSFKTGNNERYDAWCYGGFGVAGALSLAYEATRDSEIKETAFRVIGGLLKSPVKEWNIHSPMICHGYSGNLQVINRLLDSSVVAEYDDIRILLNKKREELINYIGDHLNSEQTRCGTVGDIGFLEGITGIVLSIISANTKKTIYWDRVLLLS